MKQVESFKQIVDDGFRKLLLSLRPYKVSVWAAETEGDSYNHDEGNPNRGREVVSLARADVISSLRRDKRHAVVLDIDHPAWLVESTTPGHYHLYIDVPGGIGEVEWKTMLDGLAGANVIEQGYATVSKARGHTAVRLPWVKKENRDDHLLG